MGMKMYGPWTFGLVKVNKVVKKGEMDKDGERVTKPSTLPGGNIQNICYTCG